MTWTKNIVLTNMSKFGRVRGVMINCGNNSNSNSNAHHEWLAPTTLVLSDSLSCLQPLPFFYSCCRICLSLTLRRLPGRLTYKRAFVAITRQPTRHHQLQPPHPLQSFPSSRLRLIFASAPGDDDPLLFLPVAAAAICFANLAPPASDANRWRGTEGLQLRYSWGTDWSWQVQSREVSESPSWLNGLPSLWLWKDRRAAEQRTPGRR